MNYIHESVLVSSIYDMGVARLFKYISQLALISENLRTGIEARVEYQIDTDIDNDIWISAGAFYLSPESVIDIDHGKVKRFRFRIRLITNDADTPPIVVATVVEGFARTPVKKQYVMTALVAHTQRNLAGTNKDNDPDLFLAWLEDVSGSSRKVYMESIWRSAHQKNVIVEPPELHRDFSNTKQGFWGGEIGLIVRDR